MAVQLTLEPQGVRGADPPHTQNLRTIYIQPSVCMIPPYLLSWIQPTLDRAVL